MKKIYLFFVFLFIFGCEYGSSQLVKKTPIECPNILFSKEHRVYLDTVFESISINNVSYKAEINNAAFINQCQLIDNNISTELSVLFLVKPIIQDKKFIQLPFYLAFLDNSQNLMDIEYFFLSEEFDINNENSLKMETEIIYNLKIDFTKKNIPSDIILGFMLDENRKQLKN